MGTVTSEKGTLKLVHPGRYVEIHKEPITAAEVMKKNPRHSITRPDVFEYPWIVVKPESVLNLGRVFFIVPNRTIYHLLKVKGLPYQPSRQSQSPTSPLKSYAGTTPKHQEHGKFLQQCRLRSMSWAEDSPQIQAQDYGMRYRKPSQVHYCWPEVIAKRKNSHLEVKENSTSRIRSFNAKDKYFSDSSISAKFPKREDRNIEFEHDKQVPVLTSCLRKEDSVRNSRHLRVSFVLPMRDEEPETRITESQPEFPGFFNC